MRSEREPPSVLAVLVVKDGARWLRRSIAALARQTHPRLGVLAVDNGSSDGSAEMLERLLGPRRVIRLGRNVGFPAAVGHAMRSPAAGQADFLLLIHDDTALAPDAVACLVESAGAAPDIGAVGPKVMDELDRRVLRDVGRTVDRFGSPYAALEEGEIDQGQYDTPREVLYLSSAAMLIRREAWTRVGPPDERLRPAHGDLDLGWRIHTAGYRVVMEPRAVAFHRSAGDRGERSGAAVERGRFLQERASLVAMLKNYRLPTLLWVLPLYAMQGVAKVLLFLLLRRFSSARQVVAAWGWSLLQVPGTVRRRVRAQAVRRVPDREVTSLLAPTSARFRRWTGQASSVFFGRARPPLDPEEEVEVPPLGTRVAGLVLDHPVGVTAGAGLLVALVAFREILLASPLEGGTLPVFPRGASDLFSALAQGWSDRLGHPSTVNPALAVLGAAGAITLGSTGTLAWLAVAASPFLAGAAALRATVRRAVPRGAAIAAAICFVLSAVFMWAISEGRLEALVFLVALPWLVSRVGRPFEQRVDRLLPWAAGTGVGMALVGALLPAVWVPLALVALLAFVVGGRDGSRLAGLAAFVASVALAAILVFPLSAALIEAQGGATPALGPTRSFADLLRLSPGPAPGSWLPALFLPVAGILAFAAAGRGDARPVWRSALAVSVSLPLAWAAGAGRLPEPLADPLVFLGLAAWSLCELIAMAYRGLVPGVRRQAFGTRQVVGALLTLVLALGVGAQAFEALRADWAVGEDRVPPAWPVVETALPGVPFRVLWVGEVGGDGFPAPGGPPEGVVEAGTASVRYAVTGRLGRSVTSIGLPARGPGYRRLELALQAILAGRVRHGGSLLAPLGVGFVVSGPRDLPEDAADRFDAQLDLLTVQEAGGLLVYRNTRALPVAAVLSGSEGVEAARADDLLAAASLGARRRMPLRRGSEAEWVGSISGEESGAAFVATEHDSRWRLEADGATEDDPFVAFGWAVGFEVPGGTGQVSLRFDSGVRRALELAGLGALWAGVLWLAGRGREEAG